MPSFAYPEVWNEQVAAHPLLRSPDDVFLRAGKNKSYAFRPHAEAQGASSLPSH